jgi:hypothetical protein
MPTGMPSMWAKPVTSVGPARLELVELGRVDDARDDLAHVVGLAGIDRDHAVQLARVVERLARQGALHCRRLAPVQVRDRGARQRERMGVVLREVIGDARQPRVDVAAAEVLGADDLADRGLHQRRPARKIVPWFFTIDRLVAHRRHGAAGRARAHHDRICAMPCALMLAW